MPELVLLLLPRGLQLGVLRRDLLEQLVPLSLVAELDLKGKSAMVRR